MTSVDPPTRLPEHDEMSPDLTSSLLRLGLSRAPRPVDDVIERLAATDASDWLYAALSTVVGDGGDPHATFVDGEGDVKELRAIKERSKRLLSQAHNHDMRITGIAGYFISIAAGLHHHGKQIGGRSREELNPILLDLAAAAPAPYDFLLADATMVQTGS
jgi:hypothetical protein